MSSQTRSVGSSAGAPTRSQSSPACHGRGSGAEPHEAIGVSPQGRSLAGDLRRIASSLQALLSGYTDVKRGIAMASGGFPVKVAHVQLIEDEDGARLARMALGLVISKLSSKLRARVHRGGPRAALDALGGDMLPIFLGGLRDSDSEFSAWLQQLRPTAPQSTA
eukprot:TRINITY_DN12361_c0_g1_i1.p1 TRINITY_DN12361_c0_g1~~TRINITY_DN12361_c0_g1_i1.p1  ORF type:complete len:171 (-),score=22.23 TRINITY_DN12361_c0_g1_i1:126-617(-)